MSVFLCSSLCRPSQCCQEEGAVRLLGNLHVYACHLARREKKTLLPYHGILLLSTNEFSGGLLVPRNIGAR